MVENDSNTNTAGHHPRELPDVCSSNKPPQTVIEAYQRLASPLHPRDGALPKFINRLALEPSLYLQQHATNPVNWFPWGDEALVLAKQQDKPIFLSIGYSTCHWCHVMAHESFESEEIAAYLNRHFISIKVDREERPDIDAVYMTAVVALTGHGGWPLSAWLLPNTEPFYGGTYFPPKDHVRAGRIGFLSVLQQLNQVYTHNRNHASAAAKDLTEAIQRQMGPPAPDPQKVEGGKTPSKVRAETFKKICKDALAYYERQFDTENGGLAGGPKFPSSYPVSFLTRILNVTNNAQLTRQWQDRTEMTLLHMTRGGLCDHVAGGFHRYTVDGQWHIPHFEKMLYDQANIFHQIAKFLPFSNQKSWFTAVIARAIEFLRSEMLDAQGYFYAALDADSLDTLEGSETYAQMHEGAYYTWSWDQLAAELTRSELTSLGERFDISKEGNFEGRNIFYYKQKESQELQSYEADIEVLNKLNQHRLTRPRPATDRKLVTGWNALMAASLIKTSLVCDESTSNRLLNDAQRCLEFIHKQCRLADGSLCRIYNDRPGLQKAFFEDYLYLATAYFELFQVRQDSRHLHICRELMETCNQLFWDKHAHCYMNTALADHQLLANDANLIDQVLPSPNAGALQLLLSLHELTQHHPYQELASILAERYYSILSAHPTASPEGIVGLLAYESRPVLVTVYSRNDSSIWNDCLPLMQEFSWPQVVWLRHSPEEQKNTDTTLVNTITVCHKEVCSEPLVEIESLRERLHDFLTIPNLL